MNRNEAPVALAQNVTVDADANCEASVDYTAINNGSYDPDGDAISLSISPAGPFSVGTTNVTLTVSDGELSSDAAATVTVVDNTNPTLSTPTDVVQDNDPGLCGAIVNLIAPIASDNCGIQSLTNDAPAQFPVGKTIVTWTATDIHGNTGQTTQEVEVVDAEAPVLEVTSSVITLWPVNHKYQTVSLSDLLLSATDNCSINSNGVFIKSVSSDEPEDAKGGGDGNTSDDIVIPDGCLSVDLRAERQGTSNGRVYTITLSVSDESGNETTAECYVQVPHSKKGNATDDGAASGYTVFSDCGGKSGRIVGQRVNPNFQEMSLKSFPNPFRYSAELSFELPEQTKVVLNIYSTTGKLVQTLIDRSMPEGAHRVTWDGRDNTGNSLAGGIYFAIIRTDYGAARSTMVIEK